MSGAQSKDIRKQVRNVTQELLPSLLQTEVFKDLYINLQKEMLLKLAEIEKDVKATLVRIDERSKNVNSFIMSQIQSEMAKTYVPPVKSE